MPVTGPIILVEDDVDDQHIFECVLHELGIKNTLLCMSNCTVAFTYLKTTTDQPFIIICDVNLPGQSGIEFKMRIDNDEELRSKAIPFVFYTTSADRIAIDTAYKNMTVQGFFQKEDNYDDIKSTVKVLMDYWLKCRHPNQ